MSTTNKSTNKETNNFHPSIYGFYFNKPIFRQNGFGQIHVSGDIFYKGERIAFYDPMYQAKENAKFEVMLRFEKDKEDIADTYSNYYSVFDYFSATKESTSDGELIRRGFSLLLEDLEMLTWVYDQISHMSTISTTSTTSKQFFEITKDDNAANSDSPTLYGIAIINNDSQKILCVKKETLDKNDNDLLKDIAEHTQIVFDDQYPVKFFRTIEDFEIAEPLAAI